jgi:hypothetical protein
MTTPEPVTPAPDTEALRQQAAAILYRHRPLPRDVDALDDEAADFYAELVSRVVYAPVLAGLRADLDQARQDWRAIGRRADERWDEIERLRRQVERLSTERDAYRNADRQSQSNWRSAVAANMTALETIATLKRALAGHLFDGESVSTREAIRNELIEQGLRAGARPIPDDATRQVAQCLSDYWIELRGRRQDADDTEHGQAHAVMGLVRRWLAAPAVDTIPDDAAERLADKLRDLGVVDPDDGTMPVFVATEDSQSDPGGCIDHWVNVEGIAEELVQRLGATRTTGPAPAAAASTNEEWAVWYGGPDPYNAAGIESYDDEDDARENLQWYRSDLGSGIAVRTVTRSTWRVVPAAPQAPAGPTKSSNAHGQINTDAPAAREDAATPTPSDLQVAPTLGASEDAATPNEGGHRADIKPLSLEWHRVTCQSGCGWLGDYADKGDAQDDADQHQADTLRPDRVAPIRHEEE